MSMAVMETGEMPVEDLLVVLPSTRKVTCFKGDTRRRVGARLGEPLADREPCTFKM